MLIGVLGINHKQATVELRETIAKACQRRFFLENPISNASFVLLSTCNRSEIYFSSVNLSYSHEQIVNVLKEEIQEEFDQKLYTFFGFDCFLHLARVTSGLDSAIIAETEIQGQVKTAYEQATKLRALTKDLHYLFQKGLKIAKEVRSEYLISRQVPELEHALYWHAKDYFEAKLPPPLLIGTSEINLKIARFFHQKALQKLTFCNRTDATSKQLATQWEAHFLPWAHLWEAWHTYDFIICATKSPHHILVDDGPYSPTQKKLLIDLAVPRNIDPALKRQNVELLNIDDLNLHLYERKDLLEQKIAQAETKVLERVKTQILLFRTKPTALQLAN